MEKTPYLAVSKSAVAAKYDEMRRCLNSVDNLYYAIKACPLPEIVSMLAEKGCSFDLASVGELDLALSCGAPAERCSFGNTIKTSSDIAYFYSKGVRMFVTDSMSDLERIADNAPGCRVYVRVLVSPTGAQWPLSRKFGTEYHEAFRILKRSVNLGLIPYGVSFHPGSQQLDLGAWEEAAHQVKKVVDLCDSAGIKLPMVNIGGGFPAMYIEGHPELKDYGKAISDSIAKLGFGRVIAEPGRGLVGDAGQLVSRVILVDDKGGGDRWTFIDAGRFRGLAETEGEAIKYRMRWYSEDGTELSTNNGVPSILAGPTCDSADIMYEKNMIMTPEKLKQGDYVVIDGTGAYTTSYSAVCFNGFDPIRAYVVD